MPFMKNLMKGANSIFKKKNSIGSSCPSTNCDDSNCGSEYDDFDSPGPRKLFQKHENLKDKLVGVVVTIFQDSSFDKMFREVRPQTVPGERVSTYCIGCRDVKLLHAYLSATVPIPEDQLMWKCLVADINQVEADSVTFNWECCSACGDKCFPCESSEIDMYSDVSSLVQAPDSWVCIACTLENEESASRCAVCDAERPQGSSQNPEQMRWACVACTMENEASASACVMCETVRNSTLESGSHAVPEPPEIQPTQNQGSETMEFMGLALRRGHTVMCSDFSLKSLLYEWSEQHLGPNPFIKIGEVDRHIQLEFAPSDLTHEDVPQQLQVVGELCRDQGKAIVSAMSNTILYTVDPNRSRTGEYDLKVLTVVTDTAYGLPNLGDEMRCSIGEGQSLKRGAAGHVTLTYPSGGQLVTSMGHWIELTRIDVTAESVLRAAEHNFGVSEAADFRQEYFSKGTDSERAECLQKNARKLVQQSVPTKMKCRTKF